MSVIASKNITVSIHSDTGALVTSLRSNTQSGDSLVLECTELSTGGMDTFTFTADATNKDIFFNGMECRLWIDGLHWYTGYVDTLPTKDTSENLITIEGKGFVQRLKEVTLDKTYTDITVLDIFEDIDLYNLLSPTGVSLNFSKIELPELSNLITIEFKEKSFFDVFETILSIINTDYLTNLYTWGVDEEKQLYFKNLESTVQKHFFEGYDYQYPQATKKESGLVNKIFVYRTSLADSKVTEFVGTYGEAKSQGLFGLKEKKITFSDYINTETIDYIVKGILEKHAYPVDVVELTDLEISAPLFLGYYGLSNRRKIYVFVINGLEDLEEWSIGQLLNTTANISAEQVFTGRQSLKLITESGCSGDFLEHVLSENIVNPLSINLTAYFTDANADITIRFFDTLNQHVDINFTSANLTINEWHTKTIVLIKELTATTLDINDTNLLINLPVETNMEIHLLNINGIYDISRVQIIINHDVASVFYLDAINVEANVYLYRKLLLEKVTYNLKNGYTANVSFGMKPESIIDEIKNNVRAGDVALQVLSK